jgi:hypothetical protein
MTDFSSVGTSTLVVPGVAKSVDCLPNVQVGDRNQLQAIAFGRPVVAAVPEIALEGFEGFMHGAQLVLKVSNADSRRRHDLMAHLARVDPSRTWERLIARSTTVVDTAGVNVRARQSLSLGLLLGRQSTNQILARQTRR